MQFSWSYQVEFFEFFEWNRDEKDWKRASMPYITKYWELYIYLNIVDLFGTPCPHWPSHSCRQAMPSNGSVCKNHVIKCKDSVLQARGNNRTKNLICICAGIQPGWKCGSRGSRWKQVNKNPKCKNVAAYLHITYCEQHFFCVTIVYNSIQ